MLRDKAQGKFRACNKTVTQSFYSLYQPSAMICEDCHGAMSKNKMNANNNYFDVGTCSKCNDVGINKFRTKDGKKLCATCIDFNQYDGIVHRNIWNYEYTDVKGVKRFGMCEFNNQRFAGDDSVLCGERCIKDRRYCHWHLCDTEGCVNPVKYNGSYFCNRCVPDIN
jgi:hypothetical protein